MYSLVMLLTACGFLALDRAMRAAAAGQPGRGGRRDRRPPLHPVLGGLPGGHASAVWLLWQGRRAGRTRRPAHDARWSFGALVGRLPSPSSRGSPPSSSSRATPGRRGPRRPTSPPSSTPSPASPTTRPRCRRPGPTRAGCSPSSTSSSPSWPLRGGPRPLAHRPRPAHPAAAAAPVAFVVVVTLVLAVGGGLVDRSGFSNRYAAVVFVPFLLLVVLGRTTLRDPRAALGRPRGRGGRRPGGRASQNITTQRTQATSVAAVLAAQRPAGRHRGLLPGPARPGRLPADRVRAATAQITYPRSDGPGLVDWVDYK